MSRSQALAVIMLVLCAALRVFGQAPPNRTQTKPPVNETLGVNRPQIGILVPRTSTVPSLFGMNRNEVARVLEPLHLQPKFSGPDNGVAVGQEPPAGTTVRYGSGVVVTLGEMPRLVLSGPAAPAYAGSEVTFTAAFVPSLPAGVKVSYFFMWGDGSRAESTANAVVTHRFADAGKRVVAVVGVLDGRFRIGSRVPVDILPPPPTDTTPTTTDATTSDTTATVATEGSTATETTTTTESTTSSGTTTTAPITTSEPTTVTMQTTTTTETAPTPDPLSNPLLWIGAAAVVLLLVVTFLLARVLRALNRKEPHVQAKSPMVFKGGMRPIEYEIEHPELIRRGPTVGLRGGIRGEGDGDV